jgi:hypothetical protein
MMVSPSFEGDGEAGNLAVMVCQADWLSPAFSSSSL